MLQKCILFIVGIVSAFFVAPTHFAMAEPTDWDQRIVRLAQERPAAGLIFMHVKLFEAGSATPKICQKIWVTLNSAQGSEYLFFAQVSPTLFGRAAESSTYGGWMVLDQGAYYVAAIRCEGSDRFLGPFARFVVSRGRILNLGCLVIEYKRGQINFFGPNRSTGNWWVEDLDSNAVASLTKGAPSAFAKATKEYMMPFRVKPKPAQGAVN